MESVRRTGRLVTIEEGPRSFGIGGEVLAEVTAALADRTLRATRVGALEVPIPSSRLQEAEILPSRERIVKSIVSIL